MKGEVMKKKLLAMLLSLALLSSSAYMDVYAQETGENTAEDNQGEDNQGEDNQNEDEKENEAEYNLDGKEQNEEVITTAASDANSPANEEDEDDDNSILSDKIAGQVTIRFVDENGNKLRDNDTSFNTAWDYVGQSFADRLAQMVSSKSSIYSHIYYNDKFYVYKSCSLKEDEQVFTEDPLTITLTYTNNSGLVWLVYGQLANPNGKTIEEQFEMFTVAMDPYLVGMDGTSFNEQLQKIIDHNHNDNVTYSDYNGKTTYYFYECRNSDNKVVDTDKDKLVFDASNDQTFYFLFRSKVDKVKSSDITVSANSPSSIKAPSNKFTKDIPVVVGMGETSTELSDMSVHIDSDVIGSIADKVLTNDEIDAINSGKSLYVYTKSFYKNADDASISDEMDTIKKVSGGIPALVMDIDLIVQVEGFDGHNISGTGNKGITISVDIPDDVAITSASADKKRLFSVYSHHNGEAIACTDKKQITNRRLSFSANKFSVFSIVYEDVAVSSTSNGSSTTTSPNVSARNTSEKNGNATTSTAHNIYLQGSTSSSSSSSSSSSGFSNNSKVYGKGASKAYYTKIGKTSVRYDTPALSYNKKTIKIPDTIKINNKSYKVTSIAQEAFIGFDKLTSVTIGQNIKRINKNAFKGCKRLKTITIRSKKLTAKKVKNSLAGSYIKTIYAPKDKVKAYQTIFNLKNAGSKIAVKAKKK